jgi:glyoxylase-like metal-dependent hydrolase (beta-lactamase superfamily II)
MTDPTRRAAIGVLAAVPAAVALAGLPAAASAAVPQAGRQAPSFFRFKVGAVEVTTVFEGVGRRPDPGRGLVLNAEPAAVEAALRDAFLPTSHLDIPFTVTVANTGDRLVLIDTGTGGQLAPTAREGAANMAAAGIDPAAVTDVVFSHFHPDHIAGLTTAEGAAVFPNARLHVPEPEWAHWMDDAVMSRAPEGAQGIFRMSRAKFGPYQGRIERFAPGADLMPGLSTVAAHGHTPGHTAVRVHSGDAQLMVLGDLANQPALFLRNPDWQLQFDMDGAMAAATRRRVLDMVAADRVPVVGYHFPFPAVGHVRAEGNGFSLVPAFCSSVL